MGSKTNCRKKITEVPILRVSPLAAVIFMKKSGL
jgi:hypothetical protein